MTNRITPALLAALDLESGRKPTKSTQDYVRAHGEPNLEDEIANFQGRITDALPGRKPEGTSGKRVYKHFMDRIYKRQITWKKYADQPQKQVAYLKKWIKEGFPVWTLERITGKTSVELSTLLRKLEGQA